MMTIDKELCYNNTIVVNEFNGILDNLFINAIAFLIILLTFFILNGIAWREKRLNLKFYQNGWITLLYSDVFDFLSDIEKKRLRVKSTPIDKKLSYFQMLWYSVMKITNDEIGERCGNDALEYLRYLKCAVQYNAINTAFMILVILPVNIFSSIKDHENLFIRTTMGNINFSEHSYVHWVHIATSFLLTVFCFSRIRLLSARLIEYRSSGWSEKSIVVKYKDKKPSEAIENFIGDILPKAKIIDIKLVYKYHPLLDLHQKLEDFHNALFICKYIRDNESRHIYVNKSCFSKIVSRNKNKVDAIEYYEQLIANVKVEIANEINKLPLSNLPIAFVTFQSESSTLQFRTAKRKYVSADRQIYMIKKAPDPENILWSCLSKNRQGLTTKTFITNTAVLLVAVFLTTPTIILSGSNGAAVEHLSNTLTRQGFFVFRFLPTVLVWLFSVAISSLVTYSSSFLDFDTKSSMNKSVMLKTVLFLIFTVVLLPSLGLTSISAFFIWSVTKEGRYKWECIFLPDNGSFFVSYVMTSAFIAATIQLLRLPQVFLCLFGYLSSKCEAEKFTIRRSCIWDFSFGVEYSQSLLIFSLVLFYSVMCPLIAPFGFFYFSFKFISDRYNICFSNQPSRTSHKVHSLAIHFIMLALVMKDVGLFVVIYLRGGSSGVIYTSEALAWLTFVVYAINMNPCKIRFLPKILLLPHKVSMTHYRDYSKELEDVLTGKQVYQPITFRKYIHLFKDIDKYDNPLLPRRNFFSADDVISTASSTSTNFQRSKSSEIP